MDAGRVMGTKETKAVLNSFAVRSALGGCAQKLSNHRQFVLINLKVGLVPLVPWTQRAFMRVAARQGMRL